MPTFDRLELGLLPERKLSWRALMAGYGVQVLILLLLLGARLLWPAHLLLEQPHHITELIPLPAMQPEPVKIEPQQPAPVPMRRIVSVSTPKLVVPRDLTVRPKEVPESAPPKIETAFKPPQLQPVSGTIPKQVVYTGAFGSSASATANTPIEKVQTGGFGDPQGLHGDGKDNAHLTAARLGSFDLPPGQGNGNGVGGAKGLPGVIASAGFGSGIAQTNPNNRQAPVQTAGFGAQEFSHAAPKSLQDVGPASTPVEIVSKPSPVYTEEARQLRIEGEVLLEVVFGANGQLHVNRVVRGLGHGLDEAAVAAASQVQFKPAARNGTPVDSTSIVHVVFKLAY